VRGLVRRSDGTFDAYAPTLWIEGHDLVTGASRWLPYETVHTDYRVPLPPGSGVFAATSNGLASGNTLDEAVLHGLCEVVERDALTLFRLRDDAERAARRIDLDTVEDPECRALLDAYAAADVAVAAWDVTSDVGVATVEVTIIDRQADELRSLFGAFGSGCHPARDVALARALTEAAQSRLTSIAGARDDLTRGEYERIRDAGVLDEVRTEVLSQRPARPFTDVPTAAHDTTGEDIALVVDGLAAVGLHEVVSVDLTLPDVGIPVVRVVAPGLEGPCE
jgi:ribosomal protein S12 methylthiotransferase accessory factor